MAVWGLREAAEQARASKVDIWRAIRSGMLPALKTHDGDFVIDSVELFRVFERPQPEQEPTVEDAAASPQPGLETAAPAETPAPNEVNAAFAAIGAELRELLASRKLDDSDDLDSASPEKTKPNWSVLRVDR